MQAEFQPTATAEAAKRRYLAWNMVGTITSRDESTHHSVYIVCWLSPCTHSACICALLDACAVLIPHFVYIVCWFASFPALLAKCARCATPHENRHLALLCMQRGTLCAFLYHTFSSQYLHARRNLRTRQHTATSTSATTLATPSPPSALAPWSLPARPPPPCAPRYVPVRAVRIRIVSLLCRFAPHIYIIITWASTLVSILRWFLPFPSFSPLSNGPNDTLITLASISMCLH